jgi:glycosyltransferase involved in cell wall biosynthesis
MKISIDGRELPGVRGTTFGTTVVSENLLRAVSMYDKNNLYIVYIVNKNQKIVEKKNFLFHKMSSWLGWTKIRIALEEMISPKDVFLSLNQFIPFYKSGKGITISHGLPFYFHKNIYRGSYGRFMSQFKNYMKKSKFVIVGSKKVKDEMLQIYPDKKNQIIVIPYGIPFDMQRYTESERKKFLLFVGMNHLVKNVLFIIEEFRKLKSQPGYEDFKLYLVGPFEKYKSDDIEVFLSIARKDLRELYREAACYVTASVYESFNLPVLEALSQNCPVVGLESAIVPELGEFVNVVTRAETFTDEIVKVVNGGAVKYNKRRLESVFSWEKYVKKLVELYQL